MGHIGSPIAFIIYLAFGASFFTSGSCSNTYIKCFEWDLINLTNVDKEYDQSRVIPTGMAVSTDDKMFITTPRPNKNVPCTLMSFNLTSDYCSLSSCQTQNPSFACWPSYEDNAMGSCDNVINAHAGMRIDKWGRAWVLDSGVIESNSALEEVCPPRIHVFDVKSGEKLRIYVLPSIDNCFPRPGYVNIVADSGDSCEDTHLYFVDMRSIWVYSWASNSSWRVYHPYLAYDPFEGNYYYGSINYHGPMEAYAGIIGLALSPKRPDGDRTLYFHSLSSTKEFFVSTSVLQNRSKVTNNYYDFKLLGDRGHLRRSLGEVVSQKSGTMLFSLVDWNGTACWNPACQYAPDFLHRLNHGDHLPSDMVIDNKSRVHVLYNEFPRYRAGYLPRKGEKNFYIHCGKVDDLVKDTVCDPERKCT